MEVKKTLGKLAPFLQSAMVVLIASLFVISIVYAATTIGSNITTDGLVTADRITSTSVTSTAYLIVGGAINLPTAFNYAGDLAVNDDVVIGGYASTTGDLFVGGGTLSLSTGTSTSTAGFFVGPTSGTGTSTAGIGDAAQNGCLELPHNGTWYHCYMSEGFTASGTPALTCQAGRCN
jgi:hypothetical protein